MNNFMINEGFENKIEEKKQREFIGVGSIEKLGEILRGYDPRAVFLVTGKKSYQGSAAERMIKALGDIDFVHFDEFARNPKIEDVRRGIEIFKTRGCDLCVAIGGGSAIDMAKAVNILSAQSDAPEKYVSGELHIERRGAPLVVVPTTAGTGSEATHFAVVYIGKTKYSLAHKEFILPDVAIVDPELAMNLPARITAETGMDAFAQGVEAYWSINSTGESKAFSRGAIVAVLNNLEEAVNRPTKESRLAMARAANFSGKAINLAQTTACHAVSYPMTSFFNIPHGHAAALTLGSVLVYNGGVCEADVNDPRGVEYVKRTIAEIVEMLGARTAEEAKNKIEEKMRAIGLATKLSELGVDRNGVELIIKNGFNPGRMKNNPRKLTKGDLKKILAEIA